MANEIWWSYTTGAKLYANIFRQSDSQVFNTDDLAFETYDDANIDDYVRVLSNRGTVGAKSDLYSIDFPSGIAADVYYVQIFLQESDVVHTPHADNDIVIAQGVMYWNGTEEITIYDMLATGGRVLNVYDERTK